MSNVLKNKEKEVNSGDVHTKQSLTNLFKSCLDLLRDMEHLTGDKALRTLAHILILRLIEPKIGKEIDFANYKDYDFSEYENPTTHKKKILKFVKFSNIATENEGNIPKLMGYLWNDILSVHPKTKDIYTKGKSFDIKHQSTYKKLLDKLSKFPFESYTEDIQGTAYEEVIKDVMTGKVLGQYFTQPEVKDMMIDLINPQVHKDGTIETVFDLAMGTGGFLISSLRHLTKQAKVKKIKLDWKFISSNGVGGREIEPDTFQLAKANMLISSGHMFDSIIQADSIREPITSKYDIVLANPPFGIKGLNYDEINHELKDQYIPVKTNSAVPLFLQAIIYILKIGGRCAVVLPDGQDLFSKNNSLVAIREYLTKTCELKEIILLPAGVFTHTSVKTCVFYFYKKKEGIDILTSKNKSINNLNKNYTFVKEHQTVKVKFNEYDPITKIKKLLVEVSIDNIAKNNYSLNYSEYIKEKKVVYDHTITIKELGDICDIQKGSLQSSKNIPGKYTFITASDEFKTHNNFTHNCECVLFVGGAEGSLAKTHYYNGKFISSDLLYILTLNKSYDTKVNYKYLWYYLNSKRQLYINDPLLATGTPKKAISISRCKTIKIPIPSLEVQTDVVKYLDYLYDKCIKTSTDKIAELKHLNKLRLENQKLCKGDNKIKQLDDVCTVNQGTYITKEMKIKGIYPVYGGGDASFYINQFNRENEIIVAKDGVSSNCVRFETKKFFLNHHGWTLSCNKHVLQKYMFYYLLSIQTTLLSIAKGTAQLGINQSNFYKLEIPIPSIEKQKEIVAYCETNDALIIRLEKDIETNEQLAKDFLNDIIKPTNKPKKSKKSADKKPTDKSTLDDNQTDELSDLDTDELELLETKADKKTATKPKKNRLKNINIIKN